MKLKTRSCLAVLLAVGLCACTLPQPTQPNVIQTQNVTVGSSGPTSPSPSPGAGGSLPEGSTIRVGLFGASGPQGCNLPNGQREIKLGCTGFVTCTPKASDGSDLPAAVHGPNASWAVTFGSERISTSRPSNPFNLDVRGVAVGSFRLECTVKNLTGGTDFTVVQ